MRTVKTHSPGRRHGKSVISSTLAALSSSLLPNYRSIFKLATVFCLFILYTFTFSWFQIFSGNLSCLEKQNTPIAAIQKNTSVDNTWPDGTHENGLLIQSSPTWQPRVRIAYLLSAHDAATVAGLEGLLAQLYHPHHTFIVHLDAKLPPSHNAVFSHRYAAIPNIYIIPAINVQWSGYSIVELHLAQMRRAVEIGSFDVAINLCGATFPIKSNYEIDRHLWENVASPGGINLISFQSLIHPCHPTAPHPHICQRAPGHRLGLCIDSKCESVKGTPGQRPWYKGWAWFAMRSDLADYIVHSNDSALWQQYFKGRFVMADESFFQTVYRYSPYYAPVDESELERLNPMFVDWRQNCLTHVNTRPVVSPCYLGVNDLGQLKLSSQLFARKMNRDDVLVQWLKEITADPRSPPVDLKVPLA